jgi:RNA polymerase sigma-70 factor (ECF subfamily)
VCVSSAEVDDVVSDTFLVAWRRFDDMPADWARGWLIGVARNVVRSRHRKSRRATNFVEQLVHLRPENSTMLDGDDVSLEDLDVLTRAFGTLKDTDQEILILAGPYDLPTEEIALALGIKANAVGVRLHRARTRLRSACEAQVSDGGKAA